MKRAWDVAPADDMAQPADRQRVALISGGGRGIGREIVLALAHAGLAVAVAARTPDEVEATAEAARRVGVPSVSVPLDVADPASVESGTRAAASALGPIDVLVNNAGIALSAPFGRTDLELWERHLRVNVTGAFLLARALLPPMLERGWGRIVNVASLAGLHGAPYVSAYTASKHALVGLTRALAAEVAGRGVTVNAICPGYVATEMTWSGARNIAARTGKTFDEAVAALARMNPGGRLVEPAEVAAVAVRLLDGATTNGETILLDGSQGRPA